MVPITASTSIFTTNIGFNRLPTLLHFLQTKGTSYMAEMLHYLMFHHMNQQKDLPQHPDKFRLGERKPQIAD
jgi:hypothetical protein